MTDNEKWLNEKSLSYFYDVQLTNLERLYFDNIVMAELHKRGIIVPSKADIMHFVLEKAMSK